MSGPTIKCFLGAGNESRLLLVREGVIQRDLTSITRVDLVIGSVALSSVDHPAEISWASTVKHEINGVEVDCNYLAFKLGQILNAPAGTYRGCMLRIYTTQETEGKVWTDSATVEVK